MDQKFGGAPTDERLLENARAGDPHALHTLFDRHRAALEARIRRFLPPAVQRRVSVSDVLQETRILAFEQSGGFESRRDGAYRVWLLRIAERKARETLRTHAGTAKRSIRREVSGDGRPDPHEAASKWPSPSQFAMTEERRAEVLQTLATLPPDYGEVLRLTQFEGLSLRDAAERMGRSRDATKKLFGRAMIRFAAAAGIKPRRAP